MTDQPNDDDRTTTTTTTTTDTNTVHNAAGRAARWTRDATVPVWTVIVGAALIVGMFSMMVWRIEDTRRESRREAERAISCAFELVLAPFPQAADSLDTIHEALSTGGFPRVTLESCRRTVAAGD